MNFFTKIIVSAAAVLLTAAALVLLFRSREAGRVERLVTEAVGWAAAGDAEKVASLIDDAFEGGADEAREQIKRHVRPGLFSKLEPTSIEVKISGEEAQVDLALTCVAARPADNPNWSPEIRERVRTMELTTKILVHLRLRKRPAGWKVCGYRQFDDWRR